MAITTAAFALMLVEGGLWCSTMFTGSDLRIDPLPTFPPYPVICQQDQDALVLCEEEAFGFERIRQHPFPIHADRPRVVVIGESFVFGLGLEEHLAWPAALEDNLGGDVEVLNFGRCGSYAARLMPVLKDTVRLKPDLIVLSIGNNEHTMTSFFTGFPARYPATFYTISSIMSRLQLYGLVATSIGAEPGPQEVFDAPKQINDPIEKAAYSARRRPPDLTAFPNQQASSEVTDLLEREQRLKEKLFGGQLTRMIHLARAAGVPIMMTTLARDHRIPPVLSGTHTLNTEDATAAIEQARIMSSEARGEFLANILANSPRNAHLQYLYGESLLEQGDPTAAAAAFRMATEWELIPDSTPGLNDVVRNVAAAEGVPMVDLARLMDVQLTTDTRLFRDRVHVSASGAEHVADFLTPTVQSMLGLPNRTESTQ